MTGRTRRVAARAIDEIRESGAAGILRRALAAEGADVGIADVAS